MSDRVVAAGVAALVLLASAPSPAWAGGLADGVLVEMNYARANPRQYARELGRQAASARRERDYTSFGQEDPAAVEDAIDFLLAQEPLPPLKSDARLAAVARAHTTAQGARGDVGHGRESLGTRLRRQGIFAGMAAENISYGYEDPREVVRQLIVDSGVPNRGHRKNIFGRSFQAAGVSCGGHRTYGAMCVINFAGGMVPR